jgi:GNAT superfamily N-acetyltransferase
MLLPSRIRSIIWNLIPRILRINTCLLEKPTFIKDLISIDNKFQIREVSSRDIDEIEKFISYRGFKKFKHTIDQRLDSDAFIGLGVFDASNGKLVYLSWVIQDSIPYFEEFGFNMVKSDFLVKDIFVLPEYRGLKISSRMEQERINFCILRGAKRIYTQPLTLNLKGNQTYERLGYKIIQTDLLINWPAFHVWRHFYSFLKNPFKKVIK